MKAILKKVNCNPEVVNIKNSLDAMQEIIGGYIKVVYKEFNNETIAIVCDEEGKLKGKQHNCFINGTSFVGDIIIVGADGEEFCDLDVDSIELIRE